MAPNLRTDSPLQLPATFMLFWFLMGWIMSGNSSKENPPLSPFFKGGMRQHLRNISFACVVLIITSLSLFQLIRFIGGSILWTGGRIQLSERKVQGVKYLQLASFLLPEVGDVRYSYAKALNDSGLHKEALHEIDSALKVYSDFDAFYLRLRLLGKINGSSSVIEEWEELSRKFPALVTPHYEIGMIYLGEGERTAAVKEFLAVLNTRQDTERAGIYQEKVRQILQKTD